MAMIKCTECGKEFSDKAGKCPNCGCPTEDVLAELARMQTNQDPEQEVLKTSEPETPPTSPQQVEVTGVKVSHSTKKVIISVIILAVIVGIIFAAVNNGKSSDYADTMFKATATMLDGAAKSETAGNLIVKVWRNAINEISDSTTDKYTKEYGRFYDDFNDALWNLFRDSEFSDQIDAIKDNQAEVESLMKQLVNPPADQKEAYDTLQDFYSAYLQFTNLVTDPTGSYNSFSSNFSDLDDKTVNCYQKMKLYIGS